MHGTSALRLGDETAEEVRKRRGTPDDTFARIRAFYNLSVELFSESEIFFLACKYYYTEECARERVSSDYQAFLASGRTTLPDYVSRCGDPDIDYKHMHAF